MKLVHEESGFVLAEEVERAKSVLARLKGLLGRDSLATGHALVIEPCTSIHTCFMRFAIDVLFVDRDGRVVRAISNLPPWRLTRIYPSAALVVELPAGTLDRSPLREEERVSFR
ncbi:MAG TPA: DUF192 domain-containing protein [Myxococcales bacterium]